MRESGYFEVSLLIILILMWPQYIDASCGSTPPVLADITIRQPTLYTDYWSGYDGSLLSDRELNVGWYRAVFNGRQYLMADIENKPETTSCNTLYPVYLKEKHPSPDELSETSMKFSACVLDFDQSCSSEIYVMIRKCDKEVQYYLKSTLIYSAYCFIGKEVIYDTEVPPPKNVNLGTIKAVPELRFKENPTVVKKTKKTLYEPFIQFRCSFSNSSDHFYNVKWKLDGEVIYSAGPSKNMDDLCLKEEIFKHKPLGYTVQCSVAVSASMEGRQTDPVYSNNFKAEVKVYNSTVHLKKGETSTISISSTLPVGCKHLDQHYKSCDEEIYIMNAKDFKCDQEQINNVVTSDYSKCTQYIKTSNKDSKTWDPNKLYHFTIVTSDMNEEDFTNFDLHLKFSDHMRHEFWKSKALPGVTVVVTDTEEYKGAVCYSHIDPHMRTADGHYYEQQQEGEFILYNNIYYNIEVQETTKRCGSRATCACGVSVRAGKDVFIINRCGASNFLGFSQCDDGGILQVVETKSDEYTIFTPIGTKITIKLRGELHINIDIKMAPKDKHNVRGLCGNFDGTVTNDLLHSDGITTSPLDSGIKRHHGFHYEEFANSWRVPKDKVYSRKKRSLDSWDHLNGRFCTCKKGKTKISAKAFCSSTQYFECQKEKSITRKKCYIHRYRKKRSLAAHEKEMDRLFALMEPVKYHDVKKRQTDENIISEKEAEQTCTKMISGSLAFTSYKNMTASENQNAVINQCVFDLLATNDVSFAEVHKDSVNTIVKGMMKEVPTYVETNKQEVKVFLQNSCHSNCSNRGNCSEDGECFCNKYYHGAICDIDERIPPIVTDIEGGGVCDIGEGDECRCFYVRGDNFLRTMKCKIVTSEVSISGEVTNVTIETVDGDFEDIFTGVCCIPEKNRYSEDMFLREHDISVSSDGVHYGENNTMYVFDSTCQKLDSLSSGKPTFILKNGFCFIQQACIEDTYAFVSNNDTCLSCNVSISVNDWTETSMEICIPTTTTTSTTTTTTATTTTKAAKPCKSSTTISMNASTVPENTSIVLDNKTTSTVTDPTTTVLETTTTAPETTTTTPETTTTVLETTTTVHETITTLFNDTTQSIVSPSSEPEFSKEVKVTNEPITNLTTQAEQLETTSIKPSTTKRCKAKGLKRLKQRKSKLSARNKKRKKKIERLTKQRNRLRMLLKRLRNKGKNLTDQTTTETNMPETMKYSNQTSIGHKYEEVASENTTHISSGSSQATVDKISDKTERLQRNDNKGDQVITAETTPFQSNGTLGTTTDVPLPNHHEGGNDG